MQLHERLVCLRKEKGLTQAQLAEAVQVSRQAVSRWETGSVVPSSENLIALSDLYGISVEILLNGPAEDAEEPEAVETWATEPSTPESAPPVPAAEPAPMPESGTQHRYRKLCGIAVLLLLCVIVVIAGYRAMIHESSRPLQFSEIGSDDLSDEEMDVFTLTW